MGSMDKFDRQLITSGMATELLTHVPGETLKLANCIQHSADLRLQIYSKISNPKSVNFLVVYVGVVENQEYLMRVFL
jgi:hypothetical protein